MAREIPDDASPARTILPASLFEAAVRHARDGVLITTADLDPPGPTIVFANAAMEAISGYPAAALVGRSPRVLQGIDTDRGVLAALRTALARGAPFSGEAVNYRADGTPYRVSWDIAPVTDAAGVVTHFVALQRDVTETHRVVAALAASEERLRHTLDSLDDGVWEWDMVTGAHEVSPRWATMLGYAPADLPGDVSAWEQLVHPDDRARADAALAAHLADERPVYELEYRLRARDGSWRWVLTRGRLVARDPDGRPRRVVGTHTDVTARRALEAQLQHAQRLEAVGQFASTIAHDFNNVLQVVRMGTDLAATTLDPAHPAADDLAAVHAAAERGSALVRQLLAFGRQQALRPRPVVLNDVVAGALPLLRRLLGARVAVEPVLADGLAPVLADPVQLEAVLLNLAANARDAMRDTAAPRLTIVTADMRVGAPGAPPRPRDGEVVPPDLTAVLGGAAASRDLPPGAYALLAVRDTGRGMDAATRARAFEPFFTTKAPGEGTGLGLASVYGVVMQLGGRVALDSAPGGGTTVALYLPALPSGADAATAASADPPQDRAVGRRPRPDA